MTQVNATSGTSSVFSTFSASGSPQLALAMLQMELAKTNKDQALSGIKEIEGEQAKKKEIADVLNQAREYKASPDRYTKDAGGKPYTDPAFNKKVEAMGLTVPNTPKDTDKNKAEWDKLIAQLQTKMDTVGANIQTQMVQLQDFMGQYNSYMQGANSAIATSNQVLTSLAKGQ